MNRRTLIAAASAAFFSSACGGGGGDDPTTYAIYGGSWMWGTIPEGRLAVPPAVRLAELLGSPVADYSLGAATLREAHGEPVPFPDGRILTVDRMPHGRFPEHFHTHPADVVLMRYGGSDAMLGTTPDRFYDLYCSAVRGAQQGQCRPVIVGLYDHPTERFAEYDLIAQRVARDCGCQYIPLAQATHWPDGFADDIHAGQELSDRWCAVIVEHLKKA